LCREAFCSLPEKERLGATPAANDVRENESAFKNFLEACYSKIDGNGNGVAGLQPDTKAFVLQTYGALFKRDADKIEFQCSGFRLTDRIIVTARHCIYDNPNYQPYPQQFIFRSLAAPSVDVPIVGEIPNEADTARNKIANDFDDYWYLLTEKVPFTLSSSSFRGDYPRQMRMVVGGVNLLAYILFSNMDPARWASAYRFSITTGAQWLPWSLLPTPPSTDSAKARCIYHKASSFAGMSGAPIIGEEHTTPTERQLFVFGMHLRTGVPDNTYLLESDCGAYPGFNVALALPKNALNKTAPSNNSSH